MKDPHKAVLINVIVVAIAAIILVSLYCSFPAPEPVPVQEVEYEYVLWSYGYLKVDTGLDQAVRDGWEPVSMTRWVEGGVAMYAIIFRRPLPVATLL